MIHQHRKSSTQQKKGHRLHKLKIKIQFQRIEQNQKHHNINELMKRRSRPWNSISNRWKQRRTRIERQEEKVPRCVHQRSPVSPLKDQNLKPAKDLGEEHSGFHFVAIVYPRRSLASSSWSSTALRLRASRSAPWIRSSRGQRGFEKKERSAIPVAKIMVCNFIWPRERRLEIIEEGDIVTFYRQ